MAKLRDGEQPDESGHASALAKKRTREQLAMAPDRCDECGGELRPEGGCETCVDCGWSKCGGESA